jgi:hypothetical protein
MAFMADNILRFPGYLRDPERKGVWKDGEFHTSFKKLARELPERDRERTLNWSIKQEGRANYRAFELETARRGGGDAA